MSVRVYTGRHSDRGGPRNGWVKALPWVLLGLAMLFTLLADLVADPARPWLISAAMAAGCGASGIHAVVARGWAYGSSLIAIVVAFAFVVGLASNLAQFPFASIEPTTGLSIVGVPLVSILAWVMIAYPALLAAQRLAPVGLGTASLVALVLTGWGLAWEPIFVSAGVVSRSGGAWTVPGIPGLPWQNALGWLLCGFLLALLLDRLPRKVSKDGVPTSLLSWLFAWGILANLLLLGMPGAAAWGAVLMGIVVLPWWWRSWSEPQW